MNKKEVAEIRKQFTAERCAFTRISACYVDSENNQRAFMKDAFMALPVDEVFKYLDIFKKTLSGKIGKNLMNLKYSIEQERQGAPHAILTTLRATGLRDDELICEFYDKVVENYISPDPYYIVLVHGSYDVPTRRSDSQSLPDESDGIYEFIACGICPAKLSKAALSYDAKTNRVESCIRDWVVDAPAHGFLFPAFNDRAADLHGCLYYSKKPNLMQPDFVKAVLGAQIPMSAAEQEAAFRTVLQEMFRKSGSVTEVLDIYEGLQQMIDEAEFCSTEPLQLDKETARYLFEQAFADSWDSTPDRRADEFDEVWDAVVGRGNILLAENIAAGKSLTINCGDAVIKVDPAYADGIRIRSTDNSRRYIIVPTDGAVTVNGVKVTWKAEVGAHE